MIEAYRGFFAASTGASAAFIGLLFVALSFIESENVSETAKAWRRIIANSSFSQLANIFFISLAGLLPDPHNLAFVSCVMAALGLIVALRLLPQTTNRERTGRSTPTILGLVATGTYGLELIIGLVLLSNTTSQTAFNWLIVVMMLLYAGALARAWEITGIRK